ncbi:MAG: nucleotide exchange factor GrpE [Tepidisphaeraceae bacterium]|jgi:molecular chaperone GrpE
MRPTPADPNADATAGENSDRLQPDRNAPPQDRDALRQERDTLQQERDSLFDRLARTTADYQNSRRRLEADKDQAVAFANSALIKSLLPVLDNFERALASGEKAADAASILKGMRIVHDQWMTVLNSQFVEPIAPEPGTPFDPATMEALIHQPGGDFPPDSVTQLLQRGYSLHGRTLRPAQVAVSKAE